ncbi:MAG: ORF6N domain-containing protein [Verrucomicrobia bacterium]|nr:ORF6N domain-containing protein [Verrucomicrobiota bacterium]
MVGKAKTDISLIENIESRILFVRGQKVMLDSDLAQIYAVTTNRLNEQLKRNASRFPADFAFQLTAQEVAILRSQIATSSGWGGRRREIGFHVKERGRRYQISTAF